MSRSSGKNYNMDQSPFYKLRTKERLAKILGLPLADLMAITRREQNYQTWIERPPGRKPRLIEKPRRPLKYLQTRISRLLSDVRPPGFLFCPVKRRSYISNAKQHAGNRVVRTLDIRSFFPFSTSRRVYWFFHNRMQCSRDVAGVLTRLLTFDSHLPTGSPASPIMAYFAYEDMWAKINAIVEPDGCKLTVYIDDVTVSGAKVSEELWFEIRKRISGHGLRYHKQRKYDRGVARVTGVIISNGQLRPQNRAFKKIRDIKIEINKINSADQRKALHQRLIGQQAQVKQVLAMNDQYIGA